MTKDAAKTIGRYLVMPMYADVLNYTKGIPVDYTLEGTFGAYCTGDHICYDTASMAGLEYRFPR